MAPVILLEVLDEHGAVRSRARLASFPATVGRGHDRDVILDDPYVDARHLRLLLDADGALVAEDEGSVNGTWLQREPAADAERVTHAAVTSGATLRVGRTRLRVRRPDDPVAPALVDAPAAMPTAMSITPPARAATTRPRATLAALGAIAGTYALLALDGYLGHYASPPSASLLMAPLAVLVPFAVWAGVWSLATRAVAHRFHFVRHLAVACLALGAGYLIGEVAAWLDYLLPAAEAGPVVLALGGVALLTALLAAHLAIVSVSPRTRWRWAGGVTLALCALVTVAALTHDDSSTTLRDPGDLKAMGSGLARAMEPEAFADGLDALRAAADSAALEQPAESDGAGAAPSP